MNFCILIRSTTFHNKSGGLETQNKTLCEGLAKKGHKVVVISTSTLSNPRGWTKESGVQYFFVNAPSGIYSKKWWEESAKEFRRLNKKDKFDVVISQSSAGKAVFAGKSSFRKIAVSHGTALGELKTRVKSIKSLRNIARVILKDIPMVVSGYYDDLQVFKNADKIVCVSSLLADMLLKEYPSVKRKVVVIDNGVDEEKFKIQDTKYKILDTRNLFTLLYVGRIVEEKGIPQLLEASGKLQSLVPNLQVLIVGGGKDLDKFKLLTKKLKIEDVVNYVGEVGNSQVVEYYKKSDVFVYPSLRQEGFPMVLAEAMMCGLPIIASRIGGISSAIENNKTGVLVPPGDVQELVLAIKNLYDNPSLRKSISQNAKSRAEENYSQEAMVAKYLKIM
ncbi:glycosyltransferase family 4 protein [Patescibacteria group bacterium]|nr:glycosyltransferase family 4 protein [Patescibacteria group bacterium]